jgi:hypothetical protein
MRNLKQETLEILAENGKTAEDVLWIGLCDDKANFVELPKEKFWRCAAREYDNGYGEQQVKGSLVIVGKDWWLERAEYDGSEWWEYKTMPEKPTKSATRNTNIFRKMPPQSWCYI